jgi:hypothetical protein
MDDLIAALQILNKPEHDAPKDNPTHCEHDVFMVFVDPEKVSEEDKAQLDKLGFITAVETGEPCFISFRFGSC